MRDLVSMRSPARFASFAFVAACAAGWCAVAPGQTPLTAVRIASGFDRPLFVGSPPGDEDRLFVAEQWTGRIWILKNGVRLAQPFLDVSSRISTSGPELGVLAMTFHPAFATNGYFFLSYTNPIGSTVLARYQVSAANPDLASLQSETIILGPIVQPAPRHNAGGLAFSPRNGYLYVGLGDGGLARDLTCNAQNGRVLLGKILRIDVDSATPYAIPPTNPFVTNPAFLDEIWIYGVRQPWRFSFDRATGDLYLGDVGNTLREEIDFQSAASAGGENFGWKLMEGTACFEAIGCTSPPPCGSAALTNPIHEFRTGANAVIGGYVYRGCGIPDLVGTYFFADHSASRVYSFRYAAGALTELQDRTDELSAAGAAMERITSFGEGARGELYVADRDGEIYEITAAVPRPATSLGFGTPSSTGAVPRFEVCGLLGAGLHAQLILRRAPAAASAALLLSESSSPTPTLFGTLVPIPPRLILSLATGPTGRIQLGVRGGLGPAVLYGQWVVLDPGVASGIALSNALAITFP